MVTTDRAALDERIARILADAVLRELRAEDEAVHDAREQQDDGGEELREAS